MWGVEREMSVIGSCVWVDGAVWGGHGTFERKNWKDVTRE